MISSFSGPYLFLSNFYESKFQLGDRIWPSGEHAFQAAKSLSPIDHTLISKASSPKLAKRLGRRVVLRPDWEQVKEDKMMIVLQAKFFPNSELAERLLATDSQQIVEGNYWHDNIWGSCTCCNRDGTRPDCLRQGQNLLGKNLMVLRAKLELP